MTKQMRQESHCIDSSRPSYINYDLRQWWPTKRQDQAPLALRVISERANFVDCVVKTHIEMQSSKFIDVSALGESRRHAARYHDLLMRCADDNRMLRLQAGAHPAGFRSHASPHSPAADRPVLPLNLCTRLSEWVTQQGLTSPSTHCRSFRRRVFPLSHLYWYWQPDKNDQETEHMK